MAGFAVAHIDEIDEIDDGRRPFRPVRLHFGITSFGVTAATARSDSDWLIPEHDETEPESGEELYLVVSGHAMFELAPTDDDLAVLRREPGFAEIIGS